jgi:hypothetical protein
VTADPPSLHLLWRSAVGGGPPIVAAGLVWTIGQNGTLYGLDPSTGAVRQQASIGVPANHFPTPSVGDGLLLAPAADRVVAFSAIAAGTPATTTTTPQPTTTSPPTTTPSTVPQSRPPTPLPPKGGGGASPGVIAGIVAGGVIVVTAMSWLFWRWRRRGQGR